MYCPQCGNANNDDASFCAKCGFDLAEHRRQWQLTPADQTPGEAQANEDTTGEQPAAGQQPSYGQQPGSQPSAYPPPYQQQYQPTYQTPPYQSQYYQGGGYQPPGYQPPGYQPTYNYGSIPNIPSYMGWAIATLILCFWPTGIVAVVFASKVGNRLALGDIPGAQDASRKAKMWTWITFGIGVAAWVLVIISIIVAATTAVNTLDLNVY
jgi:hypothetical protein